MSVRVIKNCAINQKTLETVEIVYREHEIALQVFFRNPKGI
jgi:hypothetical protein